MSRKILSILLLAVAPFLLSAQVPNDPEATRKTKSLYKNLNAISDQGIMFGHEDAQAYGIGWVADKDRSDIKTLTGSYPAVHGWDLGDLGITPYNLDSVDFDNMLTWIKKVYKRGGINTISWHLDNPVSNGSSWDKTVAVKHLLPGGSHHTKYKLILDKLASFFKHCKVGFVKIPIIFRPWHEHNGSWFWWGKEHCTEEEYIALWRFTVEYLRDEKNVHNLIYAFSPDRSRMAVCDSREEYLYGYPGDEYVDILGIDNYWDVGREGNKNSMEDQNANMIKSLEMLVGLAEEKKKVAAFTETGQNMLTDEKWFSNYLLEPLKSSPKALKIAYVLVWRNARKDHHYAPYPGHPSVENFLKFRADAIIFFEDDLPKMYK